MLELIVLGLIPGTNIQLTVTWVMFLMAGLSVVAFIMFDYKRLKHRFGRSRQPVTFVRRVTA